jgi:hypothetical protein
LEQLVEVLLRYWLRHSHGVRLSVMEAVSSPQRWATLKQFIDRYGADLFTQRFMNLGNLRGILHQGVSQYLETMILEPEAGEEHRLVAELNGPISLDDASQWLGIAIEAIVENYGEYIDYNSITTQSDSGDMLYTLLDFLRLRADYDRAAWNLRPVVLIHQALVRGGSHRAAQTWRGTVASRTADVAEQYLSRFAQLCKKYAMRLPSIAERLDERFIRPLEIDQLCALLGPAVDEIRDDREANLIRELDGQIDRFTKTPPGAGFEVPRWLDALEQEMDRIQWQSDQQGDELLDPLVRLPQVRLAKAEVQRQLRQMLRDTKWAMDDL